MKNYLFSFFALFLLAVPSLAQTIKVTGPVMDPELNESVIGAGVLEIGTQNGTLTDIDGKFTLTVQKGAKLRISCIGYRSSSGSAPTSSAWTMRVARSGYSS